MTFEFPLIEELSPRLAPEEVFSRLCYLPHCLFLDSAMRDTQLGRYSFITADPFAFCSHAADGSDGLASLAERMAAFQTATLPGLPPFQGGAAGLWSYDLGRSLEIIPTPPIDDLVVPALSVGLYDVVIAFDHVAQRAWIISQGFPELEPTQRRRRAQDRLAQVRCWLDGPIPQKPKYSPDDLLPFDQLAPQYATPHTPGVTSNFSHSGYLQAVRRVIDYIYAGDVFQVNLAQRLLAPASADSPTLYQRMRRCNAAPFAGYFDLGDFQIISASPERFLSLTDRQVEARPIKGTRPRCGDLVADRLAEAELLASEKDRAENVMIVDLLRNDLSKVCEPASVRVGQLCGIEAYPYVLHLVSVVHGRIRGNCSAIDLLRGAFPGGSITGAPKIRAMEIIAELEPTARGPYCGSLGYLGFDDTMDLNILIRTITAGRGWWQFPVGGGIVAESDPQKEYEETWHKAEGLLRAIVY